MTPFSDKYTLNKASSLLFALLYTYSLRLPRLSGKPFKPNGISHSYQLGLSIFVLRVVFLI